jgi:hypothetical protein
LGSMFLKPKDLEKVKMSSLLSLVANTGLGITVRYGTPRYIYYYYYYYYLFFFFTELKIVIAFPFTYFYLHPLMIKLISFMSLQSAPKNIFCLVC